MGAARAAAAEVWLDEGVYADEVLVTAIAASARVIGLRGTTRLLPDVGEVENASGEPSWDRVPRLVSPRDDDEDGAEAWDWIRGVVPFSSECPRLWRRLGFSYAMVLCGRYGRGKTVEWSRLSNGGVDRYFYYLSGSWQGDFDRLFEPVPATRAGRRHALLDLLDWTFDLTGDVVMLCARADAVTCSQLTRRASDVHGVPLLRVAPGEDPLRRLEVEIQSRMPHA